LVLVPQLLLELEPELELLPPPFQPEPVQPQRRIQLLRRHDLNHHQPEVLRKRTG
jgi:hypothetical protein